MCDNRMWVWRRGEEEELPRRLYQALGLAAAGNPARLRLNVHIRKGRRPEKRWSSEVSIYIRREAGGRNGGLEHLGLEMAAPHK